MAQKIKIIAQQKTTAAVCFGVLCGMALMPNLVAMIG
jgi:hypothetical protein